MAYIACLYARRSTVLRNWDNSVGLASLIAPRTSANGNKLPIMLREKDNPKSWHDRLAGLNAAAYVPMPASARQAKLLMLVGNRRIVRGCGCFRGFLEQLSPFLVEFAKGCLIIVQLRHDAQEEYVQVDRNFSRAEIDA